MKRIKSVGLDVHAETIAVAIAEQDGEVRSIGVTPNRLGDGRSSIPMVMNADLPGEETVEVWLPALPTIRPAIGAAA